jgi:hypothetical protein
VAAVLAAMLVVLPLATAYGDDMPPSWDPQAVSSSNPWQMDNLQTWWRRGWGNNENPDLKIGFLPPSADKSHVIVGFMYTVTAGGPATFTPDIGDPQQHWSNIPDQTSWDGTFSLRNAYLNPPVGNWPFPAGVTEPVENDWWVNLRFLTNDGQISDRFSFRMFYDRTKPTAIPWLSLVDTAGASPSGTLPYNRVKLVWGSATDSLSGIGAYRVEGPSGASTITPTLSEFATNYPTVPWNTTTIENLANGVNNIKITPIDRATNEGPSFTQRIVVDADKPTVTITSPMSTLVGRTVDFKANALDAGGVSMVKFYLDGKLIMTDSQAPYQILGYNTVALAEGIDHTIEAVAEDSFSRFGSDKHTFRVDRTAPAISYISAGPSPFFPRKQEGYKDYSYVNFNLSNGPANVVLKVYNAKSGGTLIRTMSANLQTGRRGFAWNGRTASGAVAPAGTYWYQLTATDAAGNAASSGRFATEIRYWELVRVSANKVRVIER